QVVHGRAVYPLDVHSLRRSWIAHSERAGVARPVAMLLTGHEPQGEHDRYGRNYPGDDLHAAVRAVRAWRAGKLPDPGQNPGRTHIRTAWLGLSRPAVDGLAGDDPTCSCRARGNAQTVESSGLACDVRLDP